jgi:Flp pilus assembly protein TadB
MNNEVRERQHESPQRTAPTQQRRPTGAKCREAPLYHCAAAVCAVVCCVVSHTLLPCVSVCVLGVCCLCGVFELGSNRRAPGDSELMSLALAVAGYTGGVRVDARMLD